MPSQVHFSLEGSSADVTGKRLESRVFPAMGDQVGGLAEGLAAHFALVGFFTGVNVGVLLHVRLLVKPLPAVLARIGPSVRVNEQVRGQRRGALEPLPALLALERPGARVEGPRLPQEHRVREGGRVVRATQGRGHGSGRHCDVTRGTARGLGAAAAPPRMEVPGTAGREAPVAVDALMVLGFRFQSQKRLDGIVCGHVQGSGAVLLLARTLAGTAGYILVAAQSRPVD